MTNEPVSASPAPGQSTAYESVLTPAPAGPLYESALAPNAPAITVTVVLPNPTTQRGLALLGVAVGSGLAGDWLLRATPWGINLLVWLALTGGATWFVARHDALTGRTPRWFWLPLGFFSLAIAWRDSITLQALDLLALLVTLMLLALHTRRGRLVVANITEYLTAGFVIIGETMIGLLMLVLGDIRWRELPRDGWSRRAFAAAKGIALAVPLLLLFGGLLMAADSVFENLVTRAFAFDSGAVFTHLLVAGSVTWLVGGYLHGALAETSLLAPGKTNAPASLMTGKLGLIEISIVLGALNLLFLTFVLIQFRYLFFGAEHFSAGAGTAGPSASPTS